MNGEPSIMDCCGMVIPNDSKTDPLLKTEGRATSCNLSGFYVPTEFGEREGITIVSPHLTLYDYV